MISFAVLSLVASTASADNESKFEQYAPYLNKETIGGVATFPTDFNNSALLEVGENKDLYLVSGNGRLVFKVSQVFDTWKAIDIKSVKEIETLNVFTLDDINIDVHELGAYVIGKGEKKVDMFVHPDSIYTRLLVQEIQSDQALQDDYTFRLMAIPTDHPSYLKVKHLACAEFPDQRFNTLASGDYSKLGKQVTPCNESRIQTRFEMFTKLSINKLPHIIRPDGINRTGKPKSLRSLLEKKLSR